MAAMLAACFRPASPQTVVGAAGFAAYLVWMSLYFMDALGTTAFAHLLFAVAALGGWVGGCVRRVRAWPTVVLIPGYGAASAAPALVVAFGGFGCIAATAWLGGLPPWPFAAVGVLTLSVSMVAGLVLPGTGPVAHLAMWLVATPGLAWRETTQQ